MIQVQQKRNQVTTYFYYRCSTDGQDETRQVEAALKAGVLKENIYGDKITGVSRYGDRPEYSKMVALLQSDDLVITEDLTRYGRSMVLMLVEINKLLEMGIRIKTLDGRLDTTTMPEEIVRLIVGVMGYAAEMELKNLKRRTSEGRAVAVSRGVKMGRKKILHSSSDGGNQKYETRWSWLWCHCQIIGNE